MTANLATTEAPATAVDAATGPVAPAAPGQPGQPGRPGQFDGLTAREQTTHDLLTAAAAATHEAERHRLLEEAVLLNLGPARRLARRYANRGIPVEDLEQVAYLALVKAAKKFDTGYGTEFLSYAVPCIRGDLRKHFRDAGWAVQAPRWIKELQPRLTEAREHLEQELCRSPRPDELAAHLGEDLDRVIEALSANGCYHANSLDAPIAFDSGETSTLAHMLPAEDDEWQAVEARLLLEPLLAELDERDQNIVRMRFVEGRTQQEIGTVIGVTQMHVSRLLRRIIDQLRAQLEERASASTQVSTASTGSVAGSVWGP